MREQKTMCSDIALCAALSHTHTKAAVLEQHTETSTEMRTCAEVFHYIPLPAEFLPLSMLPAGTTPDILWRHAPN